MALSPDVKDILTKKVDELMTRINLSPMFWTKLVKHGVLTYMEVDVIKVSWYGKKDTTYIVLH